MSVVKNLLDLGFRPPSDDTPIKINGRVIGANELNSLVNGRKSPPIYTMSLNPFKDESPHNKVIPARMLSPVNQLNLPEVKEPEPVPLVASDLFGQAALKIAAHSPPQQQFDGWTKLDMSSISGVKSMNIAAAEQTNTINLPSLISLNQAPVQQPVNELHQRNQYLPAKAPIQSSPRLNDINQVRAGSPRQANMQHVNLIASPRVKTPPPVQIPQQRQQYVPPPEPVPAPQAVPLPEPLQPEKVEPDTHLPYRVPPRRFARNQQNANRNRGAEKVEPALHSQYKRPDYANMTKEQQGLYHAEIDGNYQDLCTRFPNIKWAAMPGELDLDSKHSYYEKSLLRAFLSNKASKYGFYFIIACVIVQLFLTKICGIKAQGFAVEQYRILNRYDRYIFEIVKRQNRSISEEWSPEWSLLFAVGGSLLLHIGANYLKSFINNDSIVGLLIALLEDLCLGADDAPVENNTNANPNIPQPIRRENRYGQAAEVVGQVGNYFAGGAQDGNGGGLGNILGSVLKLVTGQQANQPAAQQYSQQNTATASEDPPFLD